MTDDEAVRRCQDGDRDAFRHLVEHYRDPLYGTAFLMTGDRALAEEQVQEALLLAWRGIGGFRRGRPVKPWLMRILVNAVLAQRRRRALATVPLEGAGHADGEGESDAPAADEPSQLETIEAREERADVRRALARLTAEHRQVVVLRYFADLTVPQIARSVRVREGTVKSRLHRALRQLRELLEESRAREVAEHGA